MSLSRRILSIAVVMFVIGLLGCSDNPPTAPASDVDQTPESAIHFSINGTFAVGTIIDPGTWRITPSGVQHVTGYIFEVMFDGDMVGVGVFDQSGHWNTNLTGSIQGPAVFEEISVLGVTGGLNGQFGGGLHEGWLEGTVALHGSGDLDNYLVVLTITGPLGGPYDYTGDVKINQ